MKWSRQSVLWGLLAGGLTAVPILAAVDVLQMNLRELTERADKVFRGTVLDITEGTVAAGGGSFPTVTYRLRVDESFKGTYTAKDELQIAELTMLTAPKRAPTAGNVQALPFFPAPPQMQVGKDYLLLTTVPSEIGLCATVGLGQGHFGFVLSDDKREMAVNSLENVGLFRDMPEAGEPSPGPVPYSELAEKIRTLVGQ